MITEENKVLDIDFGLSVTFDGKVNTLMCLGIVKNYQIGAMLCEYFRLAPTEIKNVILECSGLDAEANATNVADALIEFQGRLLEKFEPIIAIMVSLEFINVAEDLFVAKRQNQEKEFLDSIDSENMDSIKKFIFQDTRHNNVGSSDVLHVMLTMYLHFATIYTNTKYMFYKTIGDVEFGEDDTKAIEFVASLYTSYLDMQHIDFRIIGTQEKGLESLYTIKSSISLLVFEIAHGIETEMNFVKCHNCNHYFVPEGRCDTLYCDYTSPQNKDKKCSAIGAQITRANKEKNDVITREYRKTYMRYKMMTRRHPYDKKIKTTFEQLTTDVKEWRKQLNQGTATTEEFLVWLNQYN